ADLAARVVDETARHAGRRRELVTVGVHVQADRLAVRIERTPVTGVVDGVVDPVLEAEDVFILRVRLEIFRGNRARIRRAAVLAVDDLLRAESPAEDRYARHRVDARIRERLRGVVR